MPKYDVLILGASYGSLVGTKLLLAGHSVTLVCTESTAQLINQEGTVVRFPIRGREGLVEVASQGLEGSLAASVPPVSDPIATWNGVHVLRLSESPEMIINHQ